MTVKELISKLEELNQDLEVLISSDDGLYSVYLQDIEVEDEFVTLQGE